MAYVLGWLYTDGNLSKVTTKFKITSIDRQILDRIRNILETDYQLECCKTREGKDYFILRISNREMYQDLLKLGLTPAKTTTMLLPAIPRAYFSHFLRGVIDGDGCIYHERLGKYRILRSSITCGSYKFLNELQKMITKLYGLKPKTLYKSKSAFMIRYSMRESFVLLNHVYKDAGDNLLLRKYTKYKDFTI